MAVTVDCLLDNAVRLEVPLNSSILALSLHHQLLAHGSRSPHPSLVHKL